MTRVRDFRFLLTMFGAGEISIEIPQPWVRNPDNNRLEKPDPAVLTDTTRGAMVNASLVSSSGGASEGDLTQFFPRGEFHPEDQVVFLPKNPVATGSGNVLDLEGDDTRESLVFVDDDGERFGVVGVADYSEEADMIACLVRKREFNG